jgi:hypothetical protein
MELTELRDKITTVFKGSSKELNRILEMVQTDSAVFPFNQYEYLICNLLNSGDMTYQQYIEIRSEYISENPNLWIFEISAPRTFGEDFAQTYVQGKCSKLKKPSKKLDPNFSGEYDLWLNGISIEVKASRAVDSESNEPLYIKALARNTTKKYLMNFQQLKPHCCDVFIWVAVFRDEIVIWVMNSKEVISSPLYSKGQHRGNLGNEGQMHINQDNIKYLSAYELKDDNIEAAIYSAFQRTMIQ